jgi:hypothetical protein
MTLEHMQNLATVFGQRSALDDALELAALEQADWKPRFAQLLAKREPIAADGLFYRDTREPFMAADQATVTLATTDKAMYTTSAHPSFGGQYWTRVGKKVAYHAFGKITTAATPGNLTIDIYYGSGADANGTILVSSAAQTLVASQTNISWHVWWTVRCNSTGSAGTLFCTGWALFGTAVIAVGSFLIPASAAVASGSVDLTAANIISLQFKRSGSTVETATTQDLEVEALN